MSLILSGTDGLSDVDGTAATPAIRGTDANTGIFFPAADTIAFSEGGAEVARFDSSGNLLVGATSSSAIANKNIDVNGTGDAAFVLRVGGTTTSYLYSTAGQTILGTVGALPITFNPNGSERVRIDSSGRLGIGSTNPSEKLTIETAGTSTTTSILLGARSSGGDSVRLVTTQNSDGTATFNSDAGGNGTPGFIFKNVGSEKARIDSSGRLLVNSTTSVVSGDEVAGFVGNSGISAKATNSSANFAGAFWNNATSGDNLFLAFITETGGTTRGTITYNRAGGLVAYNTTSDYRAKDISGPVTGSGALIDSIPVYMGTMKGATQERPMFIAHETPAYAHTGEKDAVDKDGNPKYQQMDASALIPVMWAEIQSLRKRIAALESN